MVNIMTKEKALEILQRQVRRINTMRGIRKFGASFTKWKRDTETAIREIFDHEHGHLDAFSCISYGANGWTVGTKTPAKEVEEEGVWQEGLEHAESVLLSFIDEINEYWGEDGPSKGTSGPRSMPNSGSSLQNGDKKKVFVVHGRNSAARKAMFTFLRCLGLQPMEWSEAVRLTEKPSPFIGEILDAAFTKAQAVVVLLTPDDIAHLDHQFLTNDDPPHEKNPTPQARPNVLFEAGMAMGRDSDRTIFVELGKLRPFSDIYGRHVVRINNSTESRQDLADRLRAAGCDVDLSNRDWHSMGDFNGSIGKRKREAKDSVVHLTVEGQTLLKKAAIGENGSILITTDWHGTTITTDRFEIKTDDPPRRKAKYLKAFNDLVTLQLITACDSDKKLFQVTDLGYKTADSIAITFEEDEESEVVKPAKPKDTRKRRPNKASRPAR